MINQPTFQIALASWILAVDGQPHSPIPLEVQAETAEQFQAWAKEMAAAKLSANRGGHDCQHNKGTFNGRPVAWITSEGHTLKVVFKAKAKRPQAVTETSREAYHSLDLGDKCKEMAVCAIGVMETYGHCTDMMIARRSAGKIQSNLVSARRADIEKAGGIKMDDGMVYVIEMTGKTEKDPVTGRSANTWKIIKRLNEPSPVGEQTTLFNV